MIVVLEHCSGLGSPSCELLALDLGRETQVPEDKKAKFRDFLINALRQQYFVSNVEDEGSLAMQGHLQKPRKA